MRASQNNSQIANGGTTASKRAAYAPSAKIADAPSFSPPSLQVPRHRSSRVYKVLAIRGFQTLDAALVAFAALYGCWFASGLPLPQTAFGIAAPFLLMPFLAVWSLAAMGAYRFAYGEKLLLRWGKTVGAVVFALATTLLVAWALDTPADALYFLLWTSALAGLGLAGLQLLYGAVVSRWSRKGALASNVVIVGATENARRLIGESASCAELNVVAVFDDRASRRPGDIEGVCVAGGVNDLLAWSDLHTIDQIIITVTSTASRRVNELIDQLRALPQEVVLFMDVDGFHPEQAHLSEIASAPVVSVSGAPRDQTRAVAKRVQDVVFAAGMLVVFAPVMALVALLIRLDSPGPVLFRQKRHGFNNEVIEVLKFRSMRVHQENGAIQQVQQNDSRVTRLGGFLRRTSLDELPQLFNVLAGSMSLVGPRPHAVGMRTGEVESWKLVAHYAHRHRVKPGLTGWAQINGSRGPLENAEDVRTRVRLDVEYIRRANFWLDILIMLKTGPCLLGDREVTR